MKKNIVVLSLVGFFAIAVGTVKAETTFNNDLFLGVLNNSEVGFLQGFLTEESFYSGRIDNNFSTSTQNALSNFQLKNSIFPAAGYFGPKTREKVNSLLHVNDVPTQTSPTTPTAPLIKDDSTPLTSSPQSSMADLYKTIDDLTLKNDLLTSNTQDLEDQINSLITALNSALSDIYMLKKSIMNTSPSVSTIQTTIVPTSPTLLATSTLKTSLPVNLKATSSKKDSTTPGVANPLKVSTPVIAPAKVTTPTVIAPSVAPQTTQTNTKQTTTKSKVR